MGDNGDGDGQGARRGGHWIGVGQWGQTADRDRQTDGQRPTGLSGWGQMWCNGDRWTGTDSASQDRGTAGMDGEHWGQTDTHREQWDRTGTPEGYGGSTRMGTEAVLGSRCRLEGNFGGPGGDPVPPLLWGGVPGVAVPTGGGPGATKSTRGIPVLVLGTGGCPGASIALWGGSICPRYRSGEHWGYQILTGGAQYRGGRLGAPSPGSGGPGARIGGAPGSPGADFWGGGRMVPVPPLRVLVGGSRFPLVPVS